MHLIDRRPETFSIAVTWFGIISCGMDTKREPVMDSRISDLSEQLDHKTCRSICDAVGERLQQNLRPDFSRLSPHLQHLMDELRRRDDENHRSN
jgi:hypothetical protein